ncbi:multifunctional procollagen lysine hydroxylase and glycosyltransferase LH3-like [Penaeus chinensis]|uniref:multifunctional procollagen lysine hydroxylase and glycosyltransferase LH3-like n=1 Tax=Penaeus chinensis TaxID=139456 RepID=UPI001FB722C4|nr:multifunctional procollagen lysine hydroxylase and glycosyltransferase LH3-like [Penaeus chinensis]
MARKIIMINVVLCLLLCNFELQLVMAEESKLSEESNEIADPPLDNENGNPKENGVQEEDPKSDKDKKNEDDEEIDVEGRIVVGVQEGWADGRVEEAQLVKSANRFNYKIQIARDGAISCKAEGQDKDDEEDYIFIYLPRAEGVVQAPASDLLKGLKAAEASILLPEGSINALVGWGQVVRQAASAEGVSDLVELVEILRRDPELRSKYRSRFDSEGRVFHVLNDLSHVNNHGLEVTEVKEGDRSRYEFRVSGHAPSVILATPTSERGRSVLLAVSDYLVGSHEPGVGCVDCITSDDPELYLNVSRVTLVGVFVTRPQPFLEDALASLLATGLHPNKTVVLVYNTVRGCGCGCGLGSMLFRPVPLTSQKPQPNVPSFPFSVQSRIPASFWREVDPDLRPAYSWDHAQILKGQGSARGYWHASCIRGVYSVRHDILERVRNPYTHALPLPTEEDPDLAFCSALREAGVPMVVQTAFQEQGALLNTSGHDIGTRDITTSSSNPLLWHLFYVHPDYNKIMGGDFSLVDRPCYEVYVFPTFSQRFADELVQIANSVNQWSTGTTKQDMRKKNGIEEVPTVDQWFSQLGLENLIDELFVTVFQNLEMLAYPSSYPDAITLSLIARFKADELPGLSKHNDASVATLAINLTPSELYKGGEVEFPVQECRIKPEAGHVFVYPGRLSHPKIFHNVTEGVLHRAIIMIDSKDKMLD